MLVSTVEKAILIAIISLFDSTHQASIAGKKPDQVQDSSYPPQQKSYYENSSLAFDPNSPPSDLVEVTAAFVDSFLQHKAQIVNSFATMITTSLGNGALAIGRFAAVFFGFRVPPPTQARDAQSGPLPDGYKRTIIEVGDQRNVHYTIPIHNRPLQSEDYQTLDRFALEFADVYNKGQKKLGSSPKPAQKP